ncbi:MAG: hypothetical protein KC457_01255 [Myxococcales bacterium]|nr:hypothetical protein [Myxococcales bacterium]
MVCEGPTDVEVLRGILSTYIGDYTLRVLQPEGSAYGGDAGPHGGGWKGVRSWCHTVATAGGFETVLPANPPIDLLIIHIDADIADEAEIAVAEPCPPPMPTIRALERLLLTWLGLEEGAPDNLALWIPSKSTEAWILRAFFPQLPQAQPCRDLSPGTACIECIDEPARELLYKNPKFVRLKDGKLRKLSQTYRTEGPSLGLAWPLIVESCDAAAHLDEQLRSWLGSTKE